MVDKPLNVFKEKATGGTSFVYLCPKNPFYFKKKGTSGINKAQPLPGRGEWLAGKTSQQEIEIRNISGIYFGNIASKLLITEILLIGKDGIVFYLRRKNALRGKTKFL